MNLKPNLWTVLFVLAAGAWFWTITTGKKTAGSTTPSTVDNSAAINYLQDYVIDSETYKKGRLWYIDSLKTCLQNNCTSVEYTGVSYFKIHRDEVDSLNQLSTGGYLYLIPIIEEVIEKEGGCHSTLTFAFTKDRPDEKGNFPNFASNKIYNFATPCPPLCGDEKAIEVFCD